MKKNPQLPIPMMDKNTSVEEYRKSLFLTRDDLIKVLGYKIAANSIKSWLIGKYRPPENFEDVCRKNKRELNKYSEWKKREGIFEHYKKMKPQGFFEMEETHRYALEWLCKKEGWEFPYGLYQASKSILNKHGLMRVTTYYDNSITKTITTILNEFDWKIWKFQMLPMNWWKSDKNKKEYLKWFESKVGINNPEGWYKVIVEDLKNNYGGTLSVYFNGSIASLANFIYPKFEFDYTKFVRTPPSLFDWKNLENVKEVIEKKAKELKLDFPMGFYKLKMKTHFNDTSIRFKYYGVHSFADLLNKIYPNHTFYEWLFEKTSNNFWKDESNLIAYMKWLYNQLKMESLDGQVQNVL